LILVSGIALIPLALPVLPVETFIKYSTAIGRKPSTQEGDAVLKVPQFYADMFGWENMAAAVSKVYTSLPPEDKKKAFVYGQNYGEAGAIDFFRKKYPLPPAVSGQNNYWIWGIPDSTKTIVIIIGGLREDHLKSCSVVERAGFIKCEYARPFENNLTVFVGRGFKLPFYIIWQRVRYYI
jgi:hypothetical protein